MHVGTGLTIFTLRQLLFAHSFLIRVQHWYLVISLTTMANFIQGYALLFQFCVTWCKIILQGYESMWQVIRHLSRQFVCEKRIHRSGDRIKRFGFENYESFFCIFRMKNNTSSTISWTITHMFLKTIKFLKLTKLRYKQQPKHGLLRLVTLLI